MESSLTPEVIRVAYWDALEPQRRARHFLRSVIWPHSWRKGNFGDLFCRDFVGHFYPTSSIENSTGEKRLLAVGSIVSRAAAGDILAGVGLKEPRVRKGFPREITIWGLRGPLTLEILRERGFSSQSLAFLADPGLLAGTIWPKTHNEGSSGWVLIPHYRDFQRYSRIAKRYPELTIQSPDQEPSEIAQSIRQSEGVISSSLHGIIFAHSYGLPAIALRPPPLEGNFKYQDYAATVNWKLRFANSIEEALSMRAGARVPDTSQLVASITMPPVSFLREHGVMRDFL